MTYSGQSLCFTACAPYSHLQYTIAAMVLLLALKCLTLYTIAAMVLLLALKCLTLYIDSPGSEDVQKVPSLFAYHAISSLCILILSCKNLQSKRHTLILNCVGIHLSTVSAIRNTWYQLYLLTPPPSGGGAASRQPSTTVAPGKCSFTRRPNRWGSTGSRKPLSVCLG